MHTEPNWVLNWKEGKILEQWLKKRVEVAQLCPAFCDTMDYSLPGSSVHGILQARMLEWVAIPFSRGSSQPRDRTRVSCAAGRFFIVYGPRDARKVGKEMQTAQHSLLTSPSTLEATLL